MLIRIHSSIISQTKIVDPKLGILIPTYTSFPTSSFHQIFHFQKNLTQHISPSYFYCNIIAYIGYKTINYGCYRIIHWPRDLTAFRPGVCGRPRPGYIAQCWLDTACLIRQRGFFVDCSASKLKLNTRQFRIK